MRAFHPLQKAYAYEALCETGQADLKKAILQMWEEVRLQQENSPIELKSEPAGEKKQGLFSKVLPTPPKGLFRYYSCAHFFT